MSPQNLTLNANDITTLRLHCFPLFKNPKSDTLGSNIPRFQDFEMPRNVFVAFVLLVTKNLHRSAIKLLIYVTQSLLLNVRTVFIYRIQDRHNRPEIIYHMAVVVLCMLIALHLLVCLAVRPPCRRLQMTQSLSQPPLVPSPLDPICQACQPLSDDT